MELSARDVERFAGLALGCVQREYPNKLAHILNSDADVRPPRELTPAFYGCFDWHSSVHGHWLLVRLLRLFPEAGFAKRARVALRGNLSAGNLAKEAEYIQAPGRASFERPYGLAWLLQLCAEMYEWDDDDGPEFSRNIRPLEQAVVERLSGWLAKLPFPVRSGEHSQTAFALGLMLDYARAKHDAVFERLLHDSALRFYADDERAPLHFEPSGEDFLSPSLAEADVMRRVLTAPDFAQWLRKFLPQIPNNSTETWLQSAVSPDRSDGKLAHLDGLNLSRAWMLEGIISKLPNDDPRLPALRAAAKRHADAGLAAVTGARYEGGHWLGSFAVYLVTQVGVRH
jgi:Protein of unknown function (DUF2891)